MRTPLITFVAALALTAFGAGGANSAPGNLPTRTSAVAAVTVKATPRSLSGPNWEFELTFDTHSRELNDDLEKSATLVTDTGQILSPVKWLGDPPGGHHRKGVLQFKPVSPRPATIELRIARENEPQPRSFTWALQGNR